MSEIKTTGTIKTMVMYRATTKTTFFCASMYINQHIKTGATKYAAMEASKRKAAINSMSLWPKLPSKNLAFTITKSRRMTANRIIQNKNVLKIKWR